MRFGKLTVLRLAPDAPKGQGRKWECRCDCGKTIITSTSQLNAGNVKSCGCLSHPPLKDWVGKRFGYLTVLAYDGKRNGRHFWKCRCDCGKEVIINQSNLKIGHSVSCGCRALPIYPKHFVDGTCIESIRSKKIASSNTSGVRGVYQVKQTGKWAAQITFKGTTRYLGTFRTLEEAAAARHVAEEQFEEFLEEFDKKMAHKG